MSNDHRPDVFEASEDRLATIKVAGRQRRARRHVRVAAVAGVTLAVVVGAPILTAQRADRDSGAGLAAGPPAECLNSTDPACGAFRWDPAPARNQPLRATMDGAVVDGRQATVTVRWDDPDAPRADAPVVCWDDPCPPPPDPCVQSLATGPWTLPPATPGSGELRFTHAYAGAGSHRVSVVVRSHAWPERSCAPGPGDPYSDTVTLTALVMTTQP